MLWMRIVRRFGRSRLRGDGGMATVEYAMLFVAAAALGGLMYKVVTSSATQAALAGIVARALSG